MYLLSPPKHCQHFGELLVGRENSYTMKWCSLASVELPTSASTLASILRETWPTCRTLTAGIQNF